MRTPCHDKQIIPKFNTTLARPSKPGKEVIFSSRQEALGRFTTLFPCTLERSCVLFQRHTPLMRLLVELRQQLFSGMFFIWIGATHPRILNAAVNIVASYPPYRNICECIQYSMREIHLVSSVDTAPWRSVVDPTCLRRHCTP